MDIRLLPEKDLTNYDGLPIPHRTASATIAKLRALCVDGSLKDFQDEMDSLLSNPQPEVFDIVDLHDVMMEAIQQDRVEIVSNLLFHGFPIQPFYTRKATECKAKRVLECFLEAGWSINEPVDVLKPPVLCYAVTDAEMTSWLLDHGANPNAPCEVDCTPLSYAVRNASLSVIELLLNRGGDVQKGQLLQYAVSRDQEIEDVISLLVDRGAPLNATMYEDGPTLMRFAPMSLGTALHVATEQGKTNAIRLLIQLGADTGVKDANGDTALEWAQKWDKTEMVQLLKALEDRS
ncbi:uncharacterized protein N7477_005257 [Penicillium maclennaniae]|uniref:uncharacterized protein n=1 Tax=Penicillium maclennaniae TaxID=1343394 RepID=UPI0025420E0E|nr:uncharacterized protein N7477_005257 [Penicillium maclennaniae]KAJ5669894.1 hypothetical protein N7477_005257 [Penicillium maclennaniae]